MKDEVVSALQKKKKNLKKKILETLGKRNLKEMKQVKTLWKREKKKFFFLF